jgi:hypothetical protein
MRSKKTAGWKKLFPLFLNRSSAIKKEMRYLALCKNEDALKTPLPDAQMHPKIHQSLTRKTHLPCVYAYKMSQVPCWDGKEV